MAKFDKADLERRMKGAVESLRHDLADAKYDQETPSYWTKSDARVQTPFYGFEHVTLVRGHGDEPGAEHPVIEADRGVHVVGDEGEVVDPPPGRYPGIAHGRSLRPTRSLRPCSRHPRRGR
mgnify:CR=1 FL=1